MWAGPFVIARTATFVAAVAAAVAVQRLRPWRTMHASTAVNLVFWLAGAVLTALVCGGCTITVSRLCARSGFGLFHIVPAPLWVSLPVTIAGLDLVSYLWHRLNHAVPFLWRFHQVHHSDTAFTVSTAARFHPGELFLSFPLRMAGVRFSAHRPSRWRYLKWCLQPSTFLSTATSTTHVLSNVAWGRC